MMIEESKRAEAIITTMELYGGFFVQALAIAFRRADQINFEELRRAFPEYWEEYRQMSEVHAKKGSNP